MQQTKQKTEQATKQAILNSVKQLTELETTDVKKFDIVHKISKLSKTLNQKGLYFRIVKQDGQIIKAEHLRENYFSKGDVFRIDYYINPESVGRKKRLSAFDVARLIIINSNIEPDGKKPVSDKKISELLKNIEDDEKWRYQILIFKLKNVLDNNKFVFNEKTTLMSFLQTGLRRSLEDFERNVKLSGIYKRLDQNIVDEDRERFQELFDDLTSLIFKVSLIQSSSTEEAQIKLLSDIAARIEGIKELFERLVSFSSFFQYADEVLAIESYGKLASATLSTIATIKAGMRSDFDKVLTILKAKSMGNVVKKSGVDLESLEDTFELNSINRTEHKDEFTSLKNWVTTFLEVATDYKHEEAE